MAGFGLAVGLSHSRNEMTRIEVPLWATDRRMADVFVSYARNDQRWAARVAEHLFGAGFTVWWDTDLLPHNRFATVIEEQIRAARAVLVIWSEAAATSPWVRAEAEAGRRDGKLIQVLVDESQIPLPFNQYQSADLKRWHGDEADPQWRKVLESVTLLTSNGPHQEGTSPSTHAQTRSVAGKQPFSKPAGPLALALGAVLVIAAGGVVLVQGFHARNARGARIAVRPFRTIGNAPSIADFAAGLSNSLENVLTQDQLQTLSPAEAETLNGNDLASRSRAMDVGLMFTGTVQANGPAIDVNMRLDDPAQDATLWTAEMSAPAAQSQQLQARVGALTVAVLNCSAEALAPKVKVSDAALQAFLHACELSQTAEHGTAGGSLAYEMLDAMRQTTREAPEFAAAHSVLAKHLAFVVAYHLLGQTAPLRGEALKEAHRALDLDPKDPDALVALGLLAPPLDFAKREDSFRQALASNPSWPHANGFLANVMTDTGRLQDAAGLYQRAAAANPQSVDWSSVAAAGLIRIGNTEQADRELARLSQLWPNDPQNVKHQFDSMLAQQRWTDAAKLLDQLGEVPNVFPRSWLTQWRAILSALQRGDAAARQSLRKTLLASSASDPEDAVYGLALIGFVDDAFSVALHMRVDATLEDASGFLFRPETASLRRDPRFMAVAARFGLVDYWRRAAQWPDFCGEPGLPYSCAQEAAKVAGSRQA